MRAVDARESLDPETQSGSGFRENHRVRVPAGGTRTCPTESYQIGAHEFTLLSTLPIVASAHDVRFFYRDNTWYRLFLQAR